MTFLLRKTVLDTGGKTDSSHSQRLCCVQEFGVTASEEEGPDCILSSSTS